MAFNPIIFNPAAGLAEGIMQGAQGIAMGIQGYYKKKEEKQQEEKATFAFQNIVKQNPQLGQAIGLKDPNDTGAFKAAIKGLGGAANALQFASSLEQFNRAQQQQANDAKAINALFGTFQQTGDLRQGLAAFSQMGGSPQALNQVDQVLSRMVQPAQKPQMVFPNAQALEAKFPSSRFDYSMVEDPETGQVTIDKVSPRAPQTNVEPGFEPDPSKPGAVRPIKGGSADLKRQEAEAALKERTAQELTRADVILNAVDDVIPRVDALTSGFAGTLLEKIPGTEAKNVSSIIDTVKANIGFEQLQNMRKASPTGGALGQVAVKELDFLQASLGNLSTAQSPAQLKKTLSEVKNHYERWKMAVTGVNPDAELPEGVSADVWAIMTPEEKALWQK